MEMTQEWIDQYNKKCAEFLGKTYKKNMIVLPYKHVSNSNTTGEIWQHCKYHSDWNWIMEVVCFIKQKVGNPTSLVLASFNGYINKALMTAKKEAVIQAIDQFIDWYNKQKEL